MRPLLVLLLLPLALSAAVPTEGILDGTFGRFGRTRVDVSPQGASGQLAAVAIQHDGRIVAAGRVSVVSPEALDEYAFGVVRYRLDGAPDPSFGVGGLATVAFGRGFDAARAVAIDAAGRILVVGAAETYQEFGIGLARLLPNGTLDHSFGHGGRVLVAPTSYGLYEGSAVAVQADGRIVVVGSHSGGTVLVARLLADGSLDATFSGDGLDDAVCTGQGRAVGVLPDGRIVIAFSSPYGGGVVRLLPDGSRDLAFASYGITGLAGGFSDTALGMDVRTDGRIALTGTIGAWSDTRLGVVSLRADGSPDPAFNGGATAVFHPTMNASGNGIARDAAGRFLVAATLDGSHAALVRLRADGALDTTFHEDGILGLDGDGSEAVAVAQHPDGDYVVVGHGDPWVAAAWKVHPTAAWDAAFAGGPVVARVGSSGDVPNALIVQPDGSIVVGGHSGWSNGYDCRGVLVRLHADGRVDTGFGAGGVVEPWTFGSGRILALTATTGGRFVAAGLAHDVVGIALGVDGHLADGSPDPAFAASHQVRTISDDAAVALARLADGRIAVGSTDYGGDRSRWDLALDLFAADGVHDPSFDGDGRATQDVAIGDDALRAVATLPDGRIVGVGNTNNPSGAVIMRWLPDGRPDASFHGGTPLVVGPHQGRFDAVALLPDGRILAAGKQDGQFATSMLVVRVAADGSLDPAFADRGVALLTLRGRTDEANAMAVQADGRIVLAGSSRSPVSLLTETTVARLTADGALDPTFGVGGYAVEPSDWPAAARACAIVGDRLLVASWDHDDIVVARYVLDDHDAPAVAITPPPGPVAPGAVVRFAIAFSEPVVGVQHGFAAVAGGAVVAVAAVGDDAATVDVRVGADDEVSLTIAADAVVDRDGHPLIGPATAAVAVASTSTAGAGGGATMRSGSSGGGCGAGAAIAAVGFGLSLTGIARRRSR